MLYNFRHVYFTEDIGNEGGTFDPSTRLHQDNPEGEGSTKVTAKYVTQLSKEYQNDDFTGIETLDELYKSEKSQKARIAELEAKEKDALHIPTKDSSDEEIKDFFTKIGMPDTPEGYELKDYDQKPEEIKTLKDNFLKEAFNNGLTKGQANNMWKQQLATYAGYKTEAKQMVQKAQESFKPNYDNLLKAEYPDDAKRAERLTYEENLVKEFETETGLGDILAQTGLTLNPDAMHRIAVYHENHGAKNATNGGAGNKTKDPFEAIYTSM